MVSTGRIRPYSQQLGLLFQAIDVLLILGSLWLAASLRGLDFRIQYMLAGIFSGLCFTVIGGSTGLYSTWRLGLLRQELQQVWLTWIYACAILLLIAFSIKTTAYYSRISIFTWFLTVPLMLSLWRFGVRYGLRSLRKKGYNTRRAAIAGAGELGGRLARRIISKPELGVILIGFFDDNRALESLSINGRSVKILGSLETISNTVIQEGIDIIYIALSMRHEEKMRRIVSTLADSSVSVYMVPDIFIFDLVQSRLMNLDGIPLVSIFESPFLGVTGWLKRIEDIVISTGVLIVAAIPMLVIAAVIKLTSPGPVIFKQRRYGIDGRPIRVYKFRSMTVCEDGPDIPQACQEDSRVTPFGRFLRRTSLDEFPQFFNVLQGRMSVVGPRPHAVAHNEQYRQLISGYMRRHKVKPGITGLAQVNGWRGETETLHKMEKRVEYDMEYIKNWSLFLDLKIVVQTIGIIFSRKGAY